MPYVIVGEIPKIDTSLIPPLEGKLIGKTFYEAMERFYSDPENRRRYMEWMAARGTPVDESQVFNPEKIKRR